MRKILHIDMNSYFATVEQQANPYLRGKPVGVKGSAVKRTIVAAASIEAKKFGVKTGMRVQDALELCPEIILIVGEPRKYSSVTKKFIEIFGRYTDKVEIFSIDEAFLDVTRTASLFASKSQNPNNKYQINLKDSNSKISKSVILASERGQNRKQLGLENDSGQARMTGQGAIEIAKRIKSDIRKEIGEWVTCSIGVAPNKFLAKLGSDLEKPDGLVVIDEYNKDQILANCKLTDFCGIAGRIEARLNRMGIYSVKDLREAEDLKLKKEFGTYGIKIKRMSLGIDNSEVLDWHEQADAKSFGHSRTLNKDVTDKNEIRGQLYLLSEKVAKRMRDENYFGKEVGIWIRFKDFSGVGKRHCLGYWVNDGYEIYKEASKILDEIYTCKFQNPNDKYQIKSKYSNLKFQTSNQVILATQGGQNRKTNGLEIDSGQAKMTVRGGRWQTRTQPIRAMGVYVTRLSKNAPQYLFDTDKKKEQIVKTMDKINNRFGEDTVFKGILLNFPFKKIVSGMGRKKF